jgi:hypothetical protein
MHQTTHFFNIGYGWLCKHCSSENSERKHHDAHTSQPLALAKWIDEERRGLICPRCGIEEYVAGARPQTHLRNRANSA